MPRAALLSIHARVTGTAPSTWQDASLVQLWGPRYSAYVVAACDLAVFSLGRLPQDAKGRSLAEDLAARLHAFLDGKAMTYGEAGRGLGRHPNSLRFAAPTGTVLIRWDGARQPTVWTVPDLRSIRVRPASSSRAATCTSSGRQRPRHSLSGLASLPCWAALPSTGWVDR